MTITIASRLSLRKKVQYTVLLGCLLTFAVFQFQEYNENRRLSWQTSFTDLGNNGKLNKKEAAEESRSSEPFEPFNNTNPYEEAWCPLATCNNSPVCAPCNKRYLFIIATGRSGSTTLLKMFNSLPNMNLSGENANDFYVASKLVANFNPGTAPLYDYPFHHNPIPQQSMACVMQRLQAYLDPPPTEVLQMLNKPGHPSLEEYESSMITGAKLVKLPEGDWDPSTAATFFKENFPCARFIVNYRSDVGAQLKSFHEAFKWKEASAHTVNDFTKFIEAFAGAMGPERSMLIDMEKWKADVSVLNKVVEWLGYEGCGFKNIVHMNHDGYEVDETPVESDGKCRLRR